MLCPQALVSVDEEVRRIQDILLHQAEPKLPGVLVQAVSVTEEGKSGYVLIVRVPQSWAAPHRVKTNQHIYVREGLRKRPLDIPELRAAFVRSENQAQRVRDFRSERLAKVLANLTPTALMSGPQLVVHVIPTQAALGLVQIDPLPYSRGESYIPLMNIDNGNAAKLNFDGAYAIYKNHEDKVETYTQVFRQGYFESVWILKQWEQSPEFVLPGVGYERAINNFLSKVRRQLNLCGLNEEVAVFLSLLQADHVVLTGPPECGFGPKTFNYFDRTSLLLPDVLIPVDMTPGRGMRPAYDLMCQSAGMEGSRNYGDDGEWKS